MKNLFIFVIFILLILIIYNIQQNSLNVPPGKGTLYTDIEYFNDTNFSSESLRNIAKVYSDTTETVAFNNVKITGNLDVGGIFNAFNFKGVILAWSGSISSIPSGWALCDGTNGRPDLRGRFILGYNTGRAYFGSSGDGDITKITSPGQSGGAQVGSNLAGVIGNVGGEIMHTLTVDEMPSHNHIYKMGDPTNNYGFPGGVINNHQNLGVVESSQTGGGNYHNILPPFYVLAYIIKL